MRGICERGRGMSHVNGRPLGPAILPPVLRGCGLFVIAAQAHVFSVNNVNESIRPPLAVVLDIIPYFGKVAYGSRGLNDEGHIYSSLPGVRAALLLRPSCLISLGFHGVGSPLSSPSRISCRNCSSLTARAWSCSSMRRRASRITSLAEA
jgi:hypothetical protein